MVIWMPAGAASRELSERHGVRVGGAMSSAPALTSASVTAALSATSSATRNLGATWRPDLDLVDHALLGGVGDLEGRPPGIEDGDASVARAGV